MHGVTQFQNNFWLVINLRRYLKAKLCLAALIGTTGGVILIFYLSSLFTNKIIPMCLILALVLYSLFKPARLPELKIPLLAYGLVGFITGFLGILVGAIEPITAPFFLRSDFSRQELIANKAFVQMIVHLSKIPLLISLGFNFNHHWTLIIVLISCGYIGTFLGVKVLHKINQGLFVKVFKLILLLITFKLIYDIYRLATI